MQPTDPGTTIAALASAAGPAERDVLRISGPDVVSCLQKHFNPVDSARWTTSRVPSRFAGRWLSEQLAAPLPCAVHLWPTSRSYTGQPLAEVHLVGSAPLIDIVLEDLFVAGAKPARPGEFTLRAFLAGRVDLVRAEAVLGVIDAEDHAELERALRQLAGGLSGRVVDARENLMLMLADLEAGLDFVDEDIEFVSREELRSRATEIHRVLSDLSAQTELRTTSDDVPKIVFAGLPNAGKSTLVNALAERDLAIVSEIGGTTRDYLTVRADFDGVSVDLADTAGWEHARDEIETDAQRFRKVVLSEADVVVWCRAADLAERDRRTDEQRLEELRTTGVVPVVIRTKSDRVPDRDSSTHGGVIGVSATTRVGLETLKTTLLERLTTQQTGERAFIGTTAIRCRESLLSAERTLSQVIEDVDAGLGDELIAFGLREVLQHLARVLGEVHTDDVLDRVFSRFCIGK